jgi:micrococcal nuclease
MYSYRKSERDLALEKSLQEVHSRLYCYKARVSRSLYGASAIHDGDTIRFDVDLGFGTWRFGLLCRLAGIDAPELGTADGLAARDFLRALLPPDAFVTIQTKKDKTDPFNRWIVTIIDGYGQDVSDLMVAAGHAVRKDYDVE